MAVSLDRIGGIGWKAPTAVPSIGRGEAIWSVVIRIGLRVVGWFVDVYFELAGADLYSVYAIFQET